jgi:tetratricopeptide (TPR) repeat protein
MVLGLGLAASWGLAEPQARKVAGYGTVSFPTSCAAAVQDGFEAAIARLHSFEGVEEPARALAQADPNCAMAWWAAAMSVRGNPLAGAPNPAAVKTGRQYIDKAMRAGLRTSRERGFLEALDVYYRDFGPGGHPARVRAYEAAMERLYQTAEADPEIAAFYGLAILEAVDLTDTTYARQLKAANLLEPFMARYPEHPGFPHYLIHAYDYAPLAKRGLFAAQRFPLIASAAMHAQHMPSHIYSMLGMWKESIDANHAAAVIFDASARRNDAKADWVDPHGMDFIGYARLQLAQDKHVQLALRHASPGWERSVLQARSVLESSDWKAADVLTTEGGSPLDNVNVHFAKSLAASRRGGRGNVARREWTALRSLRDRVRDENGDYWAGLVDVYAGAAEAWIAKTDYRPDEARSIMSQAADLDDGRQKHILLENKLLPMRELYGELLLELGHPEEALTAFKSSLVLAPNRFRSYLGAAQAARALDRVDEANDWYGRLLELTNIADSPRPGIAEARRYRAQ